MKILKRIGLGLLALIALLLIVALFIPNESHITREVTIAKPKGEVFAYVSQLKNQNDYSKWAMMDPNMKKSFRGTDGTPGFVSAWEGNDDVGKGEQEITKVVEGERIDMEIRFEKPFKSKAESFMTTEAMDPAQTKVTWGFNGRQSYPMNFMNLFMDKMIGGDLQTGLNNLKKNLETSKPISQVIQ
jgi:uncharacterized protein YndB with AHSA1/START domain